MAMTRGEKQRLFARLLPGLLNQAHAMGYEVTIGDAFRAPAVFGRLGESKGYGCPRSAHKNRMAIDLNLFKDGKYLTETADHQPLGEWWESLHPLCRWGGRFNDGNHYSVEHEGVM